MLSHTVELLKALSATSGRNDKEDLITTHFMEDHREFFIGAKLAYDTLIPFYVKKVPEILDEDDSPGTFSFNDFLALANKLTKREITGHDARDAIKEAAEQCHAPTWNTFYRRVLLKDLGVGVSESTINKVLGKLKSYPESKEFVIPTYSPQLAQDGETEAHAKKVKGKKLLDVKMDGVRISAFLNKETNSVVFMTRNGQTIENFGEIRNVLEQVLPHIGGSLVLDGEFMHPEGFQALMSVLRREGADTSKCWYGLFDIVSLEDFKNGRSKKSQLDRHTVLVSLGVLVNQILIQMKDTPSRIKVIEKVYVDLDTVEGRAAYANFNIQAAKEGWEGIMIKDPDAPYVTKRTDAWLKKKPVIEVSMTIKRVEEGKPDGQFKGTLGALVCEGEEDDKKIISKVGSGITPEQRDELWAIRDKLPGMVVEVIADKITLDQDKLTWSLRFPRLKGFRGRFPGEKL